MSLAAFQHDKNKNQEVRGERHKSTVTNTPKWHGAFRTASEAETFALEKGLLRLSSVLQPLPAPFRKRLVAATPPQSGASVPQIDGTPSHTEHKLNDLRQARSHSCTPLLSRRTLSRGEEPCLWTEYYTVLYTCIYLHMMPTSHNHLLGGTKIKTVVLWTITIYLIL